ncbi:serine hydrolase domain-containing protein [Kitasatospora sp. NPDC049285]|uniref:serine hydrolase domain-containing protein n=1 Tax=Kitasatospora sp. NPDC049285 TaxID=3157096 RepID=UPI0034360ABA
MNAHHDTLPTADPHTSPGISILVRRPCEDAAQLHIGLANLEHAVAIGPDTTFNVGSVAKQITAHLVLLAAEDGLLTLNQPANTLLPRLQVRVTIADLITHRSGLRDAETLLSLAGFRDLDYYTADDLLSLACRQKQRSVPEGQFLYSNTNYLLLAEILEVVYCRDLADLARVRLFDPLGMASTRFKTDPRQLVLGGASSYQPTSGGWQHAAEPAALPGPGALWTTPADLDRWLDYLHGRWHQDGLALPEQRTVPYQPADQGRYLYGPGLYADAHTAQRDVFHYGHEQGFSAAAQLGSTGARIICMSNNHTIAADHVAARLGAQLRTPRVDGLEESVAAALAVSTGPRASAYACEGTRIDSEGPSILGTFVCAEVPGTLRLSHKDGALHLWRRGTGDRLTKSGPLTYIGPGYRITVQGTEDDEMVPERFILDLVRAPALLYKRQ